MNYVLALSGARRFQPQMIRSAQSQIFGDSVSKTRYCSAKIKESDIVERTDSHGTAK